MPKIALLDQLQYDFPLIRFQAAERFYWAPHEHTVYYSDSEDSSQLLHETAHALLGHDAYNLDIELIAMERDAWTKANALAKQYNITFSNEHHHMAMESYREWIHARSTCPVCQASGVQTSKDTYRCLACTAKWQVNNARQCELRRSLIQK